MIKEPIDTQVCGVSSRKRMIARTGALSTFKLERSCCCLCTHLAHIVSCSFKIIFGPVVSAVFNFFPQLASRAGKMEKLPARIETYQPENKNE